MNKYYLSPIILLSLPLFGQEDSLKLQQIKEVTIEKINQSENVARQPIKANVLDMKTVREQSSSVIDLMNRTTGVRVKQDGGLGTRANIILNGFQGNAIKYFRDGIPMDYLGNAFNFSIVPANSIDRIEIYKGIAPVELGADALGGVINIVTRNIEKPKSADISYQIGSFSTHRFTSNLYSRNKNNTWYNGFNFFYNYSDNGYKVDVPVTDSETATSRIETHRLFHNKFNNAFGEVYTGLKNQSWADDIRLTITGFYLSKDRNYGLTMNYPFGAVNNEMYSVIPTLRYQKKLFNDKLKIDQFLVYNTLHTKFTDIANGYYDWYGDYHEVPNRTGESTVSGSLQKLKFSNFISRTNAQYKLGASSSLQLNAIYSATSRTGSDPYGEKFPVSGKDLLSAKNRYKKLILGLGYRTQALDEKLTNDLAVKYYILNTEGYESSKISDTEGFRTKSTNKWGFSEALKYQFNTNLFARLSGELAYRLPDQEEFFGDGNFINSHFALNPEKSYNANLGINYTKKNKFSLETNIFYRRTYDMILLISTGIYGSYENVSKVKGLGVEMDASYQPLSWLEFRGNYTYQDFRLFDQKDPTYEGSRLRNTPYFFANLGIYTHFKNILTSDDKFNLYWNYGFVREYYLDYIPKAYEADGFLGLSGSPKVNVSAYTIPSQNLHTAGLTWKPPGRWGLGLEARNIFNSKIYDNYRIQNEGFNINFKINLSL